MALFSRRILQRVLDESGSYLDEKQQEELCNLLNSVRDDYLATEWEHVLLNAFSQLGKIEYERCITGSRKPDLLFECSSPPLRFLADIKTVSDLGLKKLNPVEPLQGEFLRYLGKHKMLGGGFHLRVDSHPSKVFRGSKDPLRSKLPSISQFHSKIFNAKFRHFLQCVKQNPEQTHAYDVEADDTGVHFSYHPSRRGSSSSSYAAFDYALRVDKNPLYNALDWKAKQLKQAGFQGLKGIFLCDGNCRMLHSSPPRWAGYSHDEVITHFFQQHKSVGFVVIFVVKEKAFNNCHIENRVYINSEQKLNQAVLGALISRLQSLLPQPVQSPANALHRIKGKNPNAGLYRSILTMNRGVTMSARMLLEILSGERTIEDFEREYKMRREENPFRQRLLEGRLINNINIEQSLVDDDDRATIQFGEIDPAVHLFRLKK